MSAPSPSNSDGYPTNSDCGFEPSEEDIKPNITGKTPRNPRQKSYEEQEILMLSQAYMRSSLDPIRGTSKKADTMWKDICETYNKMIVGFNQSNMDRLSLDRPFTQLPTRTSPSLKITGPSPSNRPSTNLRVFTLATTFCPVRRTRHTSSVSSNCIRVTLRTGAYKTFPKKWTITIRHIFGCECSQSLGATSLTPTRKGMTGWRKKAKISAWMPMMRIHFLDRLTTCQPSQRLQTTQRGNPVRGRRWDATRQSGRGKRMTLLKRQRGL